MTDDLARALRRPGALPAFVASVGILGYLLVSGFLGSLVTAARSAANGMPGEWIAELWREQLGYALGAPLLFTLGVFLCFWQVAPIAPSLRLAHVVTRSLLATVVGAAFHWLTVFLASIVWSAVNFALDPGIFGSLAADALFTALSTLIGLVPVVTLGAVLLWGWLQRHPPKKVAKGSLDEV